MSFEGINGIFAFSSLHIRARSSYLCRALKLFGEFFKPSARVMYCYQLTPIGAPMPGLFVSSEISSASKGEGYSFSVKGGKPRSTISWMVTRVYLQSDLESHEDDEILLKTEAETLLGEGIRSRIPRSSIAGGEGWGVNDMREVVR